MLSVFVERRREEFLLTFFNLGLFTLPLSPPAATAVFRVPVLFYLFYFVFYILCFVCFLFFVFHWCLASLLEISSHLLRPNSSSMSIYINDILK